MTSKKKRGEKKKKLRGQPTGWVLLSSKEIFSFKAEMREFLS